MPTAAAGFYGATIGWRSRCGRARPASTGSSGSAATDVAGVMAIEPAVPTSTMRPGWLGYIGVDDVDAAVAGVVRIRRRSADATNRHSRRRTLRDGRGSARGRVLRDARGVEGKSASFAPSKPGHCHWNELATSDTAAALAFYAGRFALEKGNAMPMARWALSVHHPSRRDDRRRDAADGRRATTGMDVLLRRRGYRRRRAMPFANRRHDPLPTAEVPAAATSSSPAILRALCSAWSVRAIREDDQPRPVMQQLESAEVPWTLVSKECLMSDRLVPAAELARRSPVRFPNEGAEIPRRFGMFWIPHVKGEVRIGIRSWIMALEDASIATWCYGRVPIRSHRLKGMLSTAPVSGR